MLYTRHTPLMLALLTAAVGCSDPPTCMGERRLIMLPDAELCGVTASGLVLLADREHGDLVLSWLGDDGSLSEFSRIPAVGSSCGQVVHEPGDNDIWVIQNGEFGYITPDRLYQIGLDGTLISSTTLEQDGALIRAYGFTTHAGQQFLAGRLETYDLDSGFYDVIKSELLVQCRDQDEIVWTQLGYLGHSPDPDAAEYAQDLARDLVWSDAGLSFLAYKGWTDSASVSLFSVNEQDGEPSSAALLTRDDLLGPNFEVSSDRDQRIYVGAVRSATPAWEPGGHPAQPARTSVTAHTNAATIKWSAEAQWSGLFDTTMSAVVPAGGRLYHVVSGQEWNLETASHTHLARYTEAGALNCTEELAELAGMGVGALGFAGEGRLVLKAWQFGEAVWEQGEQAMMVIWLD